MIRKELLLRLNFLLQNGKNLVAIDTNDFIIHIYNNKISIKR